jgi:hypothetical protein
MDRRAEGYYTNYPCNFFPAPGSVVAEEISGGGVRRTASLASLERCGNGASGPLKVN